MAAASRPTYYLGLDFGTSGARATVVDDSKRIVTEAKRPYSQSGDADLAAVWQRVLFELVGSVPQDVRQHVAAVAIDGTSATTMLVDRNTGASLAPPKLYSEAQGADVVRQAAAMAPPAHTATSSTAALPKVLTWTAQRTWQALQASGASPCVLHQADWLASLLHGRRDTSDWNNALKMGYDPAAQAYPDWLARQDFFHLLPQVVVAPGAPVAPLTAEAAGATGLPRGCVVCGGTTDSIAAFVAADVSAAGQAVTSLGSTLAIKMLSTTRVDDAKYGVYSHRLGDSWLVGGASNTGGAVLRQHFTDEQLRQLSERIDASRPTGLSYYPLPSTGERFPVNDPQMPPLLAPRPPDDVLFLQGATDLAPAALFMVFFTWYPLTLFIVIVYISACLVAFCLPRPALP